MVFLFGLKQRNLDLLERRFWQVSDPKNEEYGNFMKNENIAGLIGRDSEWL